MPVDIDALNTLSIQLRSVSPRAVALAGTVVIKTVADTKREAQLFCPVDTGNLRSSISGTTKRTANGAEGEVGPTAAYGIHVELGTSVQGPAAFMGPAFDRNAHLFEKAMEQIAKLL